MPAGHISIIVGGTKTRPLPALLLALRGGARGGAFWPAPDAAWHHDYRSTNAVHSLEHDSLVQLCTQVLYNRAQHYVPLSLFAHSLCPSAALP